MSKLKNLKDLDKDDLLEMLGLETKRTATDWIWPGLGLVGIGVLIGTGLGLLVAPKSGAELRGDLRARMQGNGHEAGAFPPAAGTTGRVPQPT